MKSFKIAVIDTALDIEKIPENIKSKIEINDYFEHDSKAIHSLMVINTLLKYTDPTLIEKIYLYNIFPKDSKGSGSAAVLALEDIIQKKDVDVIIMSVTLTSMKRYEQIEKLCKRITSSGIMIIAADSNKFTEEKCYPFSFEHVYGISQGAFSVQPFFCVENMETKHIMGDAEPEFICCGENMYNLFGGTSKAVPKFLAAIINAFADENDITSEKIEKWIKKNSLSAEDNTICQIKNASDPLEYNNAVYNTLCSYINECPIDLGKYGRLSPSFDLGQLVSSDLYMFLFYILERFGIYIRPDDMKYTDFSSIGNLCIYIGERNN